MLLVSTDLCGRNQCDVRVSIDQIQRAQVPPAKGSVPSGTMVVCPERQAFIDFFIHDQSGRHIYLQVSESPYQNHASKLSDKSAYNVALQYQESAQGIQGTNSLYVYLTTSDHLMTIDQPGDRNAI